MRIILVKRFFSAYCAMVDSAAHLVDEVLPKRQIRQWVLSVPYPLHFLIATNPWIRWDFPAKLLSITTGRKP
jgi:hypothetical protein